MGFRNLLTIGSILFGIGVYLIVSIWILNQHGTEKRSAGRQKPDLREMLGNLSIGFGSWEESLEGYGKSEDGAAARFALHSDVAPH